MWVLWPGAYTDRLMQSVQALHDPERGWYEGWLEISHAPPSPPLPLKSSCASTFMSIPLVKPARQSGIASRFPVFMFQLPATLPAAPLA